MEWVLIVWLTSMNNDFAKKDGAVALSERTLAYQPSIIHGFATEKLCEIAADKLKAPKLTDPVDPNRKMNIIGPAICVQMK